MGLFSKAAAKVVEKPKASKGTVWLVGEDVAPAVKEFVKLKGEVKVLEARTNVHKEVLKTEGTSRFCAAYAAVGLRPETPMVLQTVGGEKVTYVVQDKSSQHAVSAEQQGQLAAVLGEDAANDILYTDVQFSFNRTVMSLPGVMEAVEAALEKAIKNMVSPKEGKPVLTEEQAEMLLDVDSRTAFKPGTLDRLGEICGRDVVRIEQVLEAAGSSFTRYVQT